MGRLSEYTDDERAVIAPQVPAPERDPEEVLVASQPHEQTYQAISDPEIPTLGSLFEQHTDPETGVPYYTRRAQAPAPEAESKLQTVGFLRPGKMFRLPQEPVVLRCQAEAEIAWLKARVAELEALWERAMIIEAEDAVLRPIARAADRLCDANSRMSNDPAAFEQHEEAFCDLVDALAAVPADARERLMKEE